MSYPHRDVMAWLDPWPLSHRAPRPGTRYRLSLISMSDLRRLSCCWGNKDTRVQLRTAYRRVQENDWLGKRHQMWSLARSGAAAHRPVVLTVGDVIWDGNHTALALIHMGYKGKILRVAR